MNNRRNITNRWTGATGSDFRIIIGTAQLLGPVNSAVMPLSHFHHRISLCCLVLLSLVTPNAAGQFERIGTYTFHAAKGGIGVRVVITNAPFDPSKHKVGYDPNIGNLVDGRLAYGAEAVPRTRIKSIGVHFDGRRVNIPRRFFADCYDPNLEPEYVKLRFARDLQTIFVTMLGADGAGAYIVVWHLRRNGRHTRSFKPAF